MAIATQSSDHITSFSLRRRQPSASWKRCGRCANSLERTSIEYASGERSRAEIRREFSACTTIFEPVSPRIVTQASSSGISLPSGRQNVPDEVAAVR
jgi:hypothetical protein